MLHGLADPNTAALIELCHDRAITQALGYLQRHAGHGLRGHHGDGQQMHRIATDGWIAASFAHYTSRAGDPQLHTHLVVPNLLYGQDGTWSAIDSRAVFRHAKTAGFLYQAALRHELTRELNVTWTPPVKGLAEICGVPREVLREFSQRRRQIEAALQRTGRRGRAAAQDACLATRQPKQRTSPAALRESWQQRAEALGASPEGLLTAARISHLPRDRASWQQRLIRLLHTGQPAPVRDLLLSPEQLAHVAALVLGPDGVTAKTTGFDRRDLLQVLAVTVPVEHTGKALDLEHLADHLLSQPGPVPVRPGAEEEPRWTTLELLATEQRALTLAGSPNRTTLAGPEIVAQLLDDRAWLSPQQHDVIRQIAGDTRLATVLVGPAGSGKTAVLATIAALASQSGQPIVGCALAALTAARLQHDSAIPSRSLASLLARLQPGQDPRGALAPGTWVVVDEAGMVGTRQLAQLLEQVDHAGGRLLLVGDPAQLPEIDAGGMFRHLSHAEQRPAVLTGNQRQRHPWEVAALDRLRAGQHVAALVAYAGHQRITPVSNRQDLHTRVAADYLTATAAATSPQAARQTVVLASQHEDVDALNHQIHCALQQDGRLGLDTITLDLPDGPVGFAPGDQVIITRPCRDSAGRKVLNGTRGQFIAADQAGLQVQPEEGPSFALQPHAAPDCLRHGYALTVHKAQGLTASTALVVAEGLTRNAAYTALSRGRDRNQLYAVGEETPTGRPDWLSAWRRLCAQLDRPTGDTLASTQLITATPLPARTAPTATPYSQAEHQDRSLGR